MKQRIVCLKMSFLSGLACTCEETCQSVWPPNTSLYASSTCRYLRLLASPFGQGLTWSAIPQHPLFFPLHLGVLLSKSSSVKWFPGMSTIFYGVYISLYNNPSYSRILIGSRLWCIRGQTHDWRHHYKVFLSAVLKWRKILRIRIIFYVTGQKIRYKSVLPRHWTGLRSQKTKDKVVSFRKWYRNNFLADKQYIRQIPGSAFRLGSN